jgi:hypothetical protein
MRITIREYEGHGRAVILVGETVREVRDVERDWAQAVADVRWASQGTGTRMHVELTDKDGEAVRATMLRDGREVPP